MNSRIFRPESHLRVGILPRVPSAHPGHRYAVQAEFGDYDADRHLPGYLSDLVLLPQQSPEVTNKK